MTIAPSPCESRTQPADRDARSEYTSSLPAEAANATTLRRRLISGGVWAAIGRACGVLSILGINVVLARSLEPTVFGTFVLIASIIPTASLVAMAGLNRATLRLVAEGLANGQPGRVLHGLRRATRLGLVFVVLISFAVAIGIEWFGAKWFPIPLDAPTAIMIGLLVLLVAVQQLLAETLRGFHEMRISNLLAGQNGGPLANLAFLALLMLPALFWPSISLATVLLLNVIALAIVMPLAVWKMRQQMQATRLLAGSSQGDTDLYPYRQLLQVGLPAMGVQVLAFLTSQCDIWIAAAAFSGDDLALFGAARRILLLLGIALLLANRAVVSSIPDLYAQGRREDLQRMLQGAASLVAIPTMLALAVLLLAPEVVLGLLFGSFYREAASVLMVLAAGQIVNVWTGTCGLTLSMTGHDRISLLINLMTAGLLFGLGPGVASVHGATGLAILSSVVVGGRNLVLWLVARYLVGVWTHVPLRFWTFWPALVNRTATNH